MITRSGVSDMTRQGVGRREGIHRTSLNEESGGTPDLLLGDLTEYARTLGDPSPVIATSSHTDGEMSRVDNDSEFEEEDTDDERLILRPSDEVIYSSASEGERPDTLSTARGKNSLLRASTDPSGLFGTEHPGDRAGRRRSLGPYGDLSSTRRRISDRGDGYPRVMQVARRDTSPIESAQTGSSGRKLSLKGLFKKNKPGKLTKLPDGSEATAGSSEAGENRTSARLGRQKSIATLFAK